MGSSPKALKTSLTSSTPSSAATIALALSPPNAGTSSCRDLRTSMYSAGNTSVRVLSTCPSLTKVGPSVKSLSRANVAAAVLSSDVPLRALRTLSAQPPRARQTSMFRRIELDFPRFSHPSSSFSPSATSASSSADDDTTLRRMSRLSSPRVSAIFASSRHSGSGSSTSHSSSSRLDTAASIAGSTTSRSAASAAASATAVVVSSRSSTVDRISDLPGLWSPTGTT